MGGGGGGAGMVVSELNNPKHRKKGRVEKMGRGGGGIFLEDAGGGVRVSQFFCQIDKVSTSEKKKMWKGAWGGGRGAGMVVSEFFTKIQM